MPEPLTQKSSSGRARLFTAMRALAASLFVNAVCPYVLFRLLEMRFRPGSLLPLAFSGLFPLLGLTVGFVRQRALDIIGLFALVEVGTALVTTMMANNESSALVGRSLQNFVLSAIFVGSVLLSRPIMLYVARQFVTGNNAGYRARFDQIANRPDTKRVYRVMTIVWAAVLLGKSVAIVPLALSLPARHFLVVSPAMSYGVDVVLIWWSIHYGYSRLGHYIAQTDPANPETAARERTEAPRFRS
jgi:hypothetical protein